MSEKDSGPVDTAQIRPEATGSSALPPRDRRRSLYLVGGIVFAVAVVVLLLLAAVLPGLRPPGGGAPSGLKTESQAVAAAAGVLGSTPGGPWNLTLADGFAYVQQVNQYLGWKVSAHCPIIPGPLGNVSVGPYDGEYSGGGAVTWLLGFEASAPDSGYLIVLVENGTAREVGTAASTGSCMGAYGTPIGPAVDSSVAVSAILDSKNGSRFAAMYPRANATYFLWPYIGGLTPRAPMWVVDLMGCGIGYPGPGAIESWVWANNGTVYSTPPPPTAC